MFCAYDDLKLLVYSSFWCDVIWIPSSPLSQAASSLICIWPIKINNSVWCELKTTSPLIVASLRPHGRKKSHFSQEPASWGKHVWHGIPFLGSTMRRSCLFLTAGVFGVDLCLGRRNAKHFHFNQTEFLWISATLPSCLSKWWCKCYQLHWLDSWSNVHKIKEPTACDLQRESKSRWTGGHSDDKSPAM